MTSMAELDMYDFSDSWNMIGCGYDIPPDRDSVKVVHVVLGIWLDALFREIQGHPVIIQHAFFECLSGRPWEISGKELSFDFFRDIALEAGVDYQVGSYLSGVPIEFVLGDGGAIQNPGGNWWNELN